LCPDRFRHLFIHAATNPHKVEIFAYVLDGSLEKTGTGLFSINILGQLMHKRKNCQSAPDLKGRLSVPIIKKNKGQNAPCQWLAQYA
jgi:hypothetical protein